MRQGRKSAALTAVLGVFCAWASSAGAAIVTVGSPLKATFTPTEVGAPKTFFNTELPEPGANVTSPVNGLILRWRIAGAEGGPFKLRVLTPGSGNSYTGAGISGGGLPTSTNVQTFATQLPVKAGQTIGLDSLVGTDKIGQAPVPGASFAFIAPPLGEGGTATGTQTPNTEVAFNADILPQPTIKSISPAIGPFVGGTPVIISGADFSEVKSVSFGTLAATSYTVDSSEQITAVAPPVSRPTSVDMTVTTIAGKSNTAPSDVYAYTACEVPQLRGKTLKQARAALTKHDCKLGTVRHKIQKGKKEEKGKGKPKPPRVIKQDIRPGQVRESGTKVGVKLG